MEKEKEKEIINAFHFLNPHLFLKKASKSIKCENIYSIERKPPIILRNRDEIKKAVKRLFGASDIVFDNVHIVNYPKHIVRALKKDAIGSFSVINAHTLWGYGYYHFLTEVMPSVLEIGLPNDIYCQGSSFVVPLFRWFGVSNNVVFKRAPFLDVKYIYDQPYIECGWPSPQKIELLRAVILKKLTFQKRKGILIYRKESYRRILNHEAVFKTLQNIFPHLEWITFDSLSVSETADLFSQAAIIVGPHGAGLTNMLFSDSGIRIIEFMPLVNPNLCYWHMSELLRNEYSMIPCETSSSNFNIDVDSLSQLLKI
jgi:hypothetical protein